MSSISTPILRRAAFVFCLAAVMTACGGASDRSDPQATGPAFAPAQAQSPTQANPPADPQAQAQAEARADAEAKAHEQAHEQMHAQNAAQSTPQAHAQPESTVMAQPAATVRATAPVPVVAPAPADPLQNCVPALVPPTVQACDGVDLLAAANILSRSPGVEVIAGPTSAGAYRFKAKQFIELADRDCIQIGHNAADFSLSGWVRLPEGNADILTITSGRTTVFNVVSGFVDNTARLRVNTRTPGSTEGALLKTPTVAGQWIHLALNYRNKGEASSVEMWVNSKRVVEFARANAYSSDARIYVGNESLYATGTVDIGQLRSWRKPLTQRDVAGLMLEGSDSLGMSPAALQRSLAQLSDHFGGARLSDAAFASAVEDVKRNQFFLSESEARLRQGLDLIDRFESTTGPLFIAPAPRWMFPDKAEQRVSAADQFGMLEVQQAVMDNAWLADNVQACRSLFEGRSWKASNRFPGAVARPENPQRELKARIDGTVARHKGRAILFAEDPAKRPTGLYLAPGSVAEVRVPPSLVNKGFAVLVGSHDADHSKRPSFVRLHRIQRRFDIHQEVTLIANPMGGLINIEVPYLANEGLVDITVRNAVEAPMFSMRSFDRTTVEQWRARRTAPGAFAEFVTDNVWLQLPRDFIYAMDDPTAFLTEWDRAMQGVNELMGFAPGERNRTTHYIAMDLALRSSVAGVGYPANNNNWDPSSSSGGKSNHALITKPVSSWVEYHELGHAHSLRGFEGEKESVVHILLMYVLNKTFGVDLDEAFRRSAPGPFKPDDAAIQWMFTNEFRAGQQMSSDNRYEQFSYRHRGHAKYADMTRLFGWDATVRFYQLSNQEIEGEVPAITGLAGTDERMLRMSIAAGADVRPLIHFWGIFPKDPAALEAQIKARGLALSPAIRALLMRYRDSVIPANNAAYQAVFTRLYPKRPISGDANVREWNHWLSLWDESYAAQVRAQIDKVIALYYPGVPQ
jgi:hypothetical protein